MPLHLSRALSRSALLLLAATLATGCYNPRKDKGLEQLTFGGGDVLAGPGDLDDAGSFGTIRYETPTFTLKEARKIGGVTVPEGARVEALFIQGKLVLPPEFEWIQIWRSDFAYVKRHGSETILRIDLETGEEEVTPLTALRFARTERHGGGRRIGVISESGKPLKIALLGSDGRVVKVLERVERRSFDKGPQPVDALTGGGYIAHHVGEQGEQFDVIYNAEGVPISPPLSPVLRLLPKDESGALAFGIKTDPERELYWPVRADGTLYPKPEELLGLRPLYTPDSERLWAGWVAVWRTDEGQRSAVVQATSEPEKILASRQDAVFEDIEYATYKATDPRWRGSIFEAFIHRSPGAPGYVISQLDDSPPSLSASSRPWTRRGRTSRTWTGPRRRATASTRPPCTRPT